MYRWPMRTGDRVALAPHLDLWMAGRRYGTVVEQMRNEEGTLMHLVDYEAGSVWLGNEDLLGAVR